MKYIRWFWRPITYFHPDTLAARLVALAYALIFGIIIRLVS